jgi:hypothetical protein
MKRFRWFVVAGLLFSGWTAGAGGGGAFSQTDEIDQEYSRRFKALDANDLDGHYQLALWCKDKGAYKLLKKQCAHILRRQRDHEPAKLLMELAEVELAAAGGNNTPASPGGSRKPASAALGRLVTDDEIQVMRREELQVDRPDRVQVRIPREVQDQFFTEMQNASDFSYSRKRFFSLHPSEKAQLILRYAPEAYGEQIEILSDPDRFTVFERTVLPLIKDNCATAGCHSPVSPAKWRIYNDRILNKQMVYTNFLLTHNFEVEGSAERLIDRDYPRRSLLLQYGLPSAPPSEERQSNHPMVGGGEISPMFKDTNDRRYRDLLTWLESLDVQAPDYGISLGTK